MNLQSRRLIFAIFFALLMTTTLLMAAKASADTISDPNHLPKWAWSKNWEPCANDEPQPTRCIWDAKHNGNGIGQSYLQTKRGLVFKISHASAHYLLLPSYAP